MGRFNFCSGTYQSLSPNANAEWCANLYPENAASPNARSAVQLYPTPGLELFATLPSSIAVPGGFTFLGRTFAAAINAASGHAHLYEITNNPVDVIDRGDLGVPTNTNPAIFAANPTQLVFTANGTGKVYCLTLATNVLTSTTPSAGNAISAKYLDGFFIALIANSNTFQVSALEDGTTWPAINQATISEFPDNAVGMEVSNRILGFFGQKKSVPYFNSGALFPFIPVPNVLIEEGAIGTYGISKLDNTVLWLSGNVDEGSGIAFRLNGYTPVRISNHDIERIWQSYATIADVVTYTFQDGGHKYWHLYFPTANASWRYDIATQQWHQVGTWNAAANAFQAHKSMWHTFNFGLHLVGDPFSGNIYSMEQGNLTDNGTAIRRVRRAPYIAKEHERMVHASLEVLAEMGLPSSIQAPSTYPPSLNIADANGVLWTVTIQSQTVVVTLAAAGQVASPLVYLLDNQTGATYWQLTVFFDSGLGQEVVSGVQVQRPVPSSAVYPMATIVPAFLDSGLTINQVGAVTATQPLPHLREPLLFLRWSDDGGHTWSNFHERGLGLTGDFQKLARWRALGQSRNRIYEVSYDDPVSLRLIDSFLNGGEDYQPQQRLNDRLRQMA